MTQQYRVRMDTFTDTNCESDVFSVAAAVEHLQDLAACMQNETFGFGASDVAVIDRIIEAVEELESQRAKQHEQLETETIQASILRHKLQKLPSEIKAEIKAAVDSARQSNAEELQGLQTRLKAINENIEYLKNRQAFLVKENAVLHPERDKVRQEHEEIIQQLNLRMAEKANKQIVLNETRDKVRETNQRIVDLEEGIVQLKEDLVQERAEARAEKKKLKKAVYDTTVKTREQKEINVEKKKEVDSLHEKLVDSEGKLEEIRKSVRRYETSRANLETQERQLTAQLNKQLKENYQLRQSGLQLANEETKHLEYWRQRKEELENRVKELTTETERHTSKSDDLEMQKIDLEVDVQEKLRLRRIDAEKVKEANEILQNAKDLLAKSAEECGRLRQENVDMEKRIEELGDTHEAIMNTLQKQIEECREQLGKERKERMDLQGQRDEGQKEIDDFKMEASRFMNELTKRINEGKKKHDNLTKEGTQLQKDLRRDEETHEKLKDDVADTEQRHKEMKAAVEAEIERLETEITEMETSTVTKWNTINDKTPGFQQLENEFAEKTKAYDKIKKDVVEMKSKKQSLDDNCKRTKQDIEKMVTPQTVMRKELNDKRKESLSSMKSRADEVKEVERNIYTLGCKLKTAIEENDRFSQANKKQEQEIADFEAMTKKNEEQYKRLQVEFASLRGSLESVWDEDSSLTRQYADRDDQVVQDLGLLLDRTGLREKKISDITDKLQKELEFLSVFLDNVSARRPRESRSTSGKQTTVTSHVNSAAISEVANANKLKSTLSSVNPRSPRKS